MDGSGYSFRGLDVEDLSPEGFEEFCKELAAEWASKNLMTGNYSIHYRKREPIDITISERKPNVSLPGQIIGESRSDSHEHFIECKFYKKNLGLEVLGKTYIMTLRHQPKSLVIATNVSLTDTAVEFADWLGSQISDFACSVWNPLETKADVDGKEKPLASNDYFTKHIKPFVVEKWSLFEERIFVKNRIAGFPNKSGPNRLFIDKNSDYVFESVIEKTSTSRKVRDVQLLLKTSIDHEYQLNLSFRTGINHRILVSGLLNGLPFNEEYEVVKAFFVVESSSGQDIIPLDYFPRLVVSTELISLPDLRDGLSTNLYVRWIQEKDKPVLSLVGEGGIGKTYLCERICILAKAEGLKVMHSALTMDSQPGFINELVWLLIPETLRITLENSELEEFNEDLLGYFFEYFENGRNSSECKALRRLLTQQNWEQAEPEVIVNAIIRVISKSSFFLVLVLSNCHRISSACAEVLRVLFASLEANHWADNHLRVILEYRDTPEDQGTHWKKLNTWINANFSNRLFSHTLKKLNRNDLKSSLDNFVVSSSNNTFQEIIIEKTGGNPLFVKMLLMSLMEQGILVRKNFGESHPIYSLESLQVLKKFIVVLSSDIETLLVTRINYWHKTFLSKEISYGGFVLALKAAIGIDISLKFLAKLIGASPEEIEIVLVKLQRADLLQRASESNFIFAHEYINEASKKWLNFQYDREERILLAIENCAVTDYNSAFSKGRLQGLIARKDSAIESFNAALQFSEGGFSKMYSAHQEILKIFDPTKIEVEEHILFLANLKNLIFIGDYIGTATDIISFNKLGVRVLRHLEISDSKKRPFFRQYFHNLSHTAISMGAILDYITYGDQALNYCQSEIEFAQFLNRLVKCCSTVGQFELGRNAGTLALQLQQILDPSIDPDLESVILGDLYNLYMPHSSNVAQKITEMIIECPCSDRQRSHNLHLVIHHNLVESRVSETSNSRTYLEGIISEKELVSMRQAQLGIDGTIDFLNDNVDSAYEKIKRAYMNAVWSESIQEELVFGNNLLVLMHFTGNVSEIENLNKRLAVLCSKYEVDNLIPMLQTLYNRCELIVRKRFKLFPLAEQYQEIVPKVDGLKKSLRDVIVKNSQNLVLLGDLEKSSFHLFEGFTGKQPESVSATNYSRNIISFETSKEELNLYLVS